MFSLIKKIKIVKDLIFYKLDDMLNRVDILDSMLNSRLKKLEDESHQNNDLIHSLIKNDNSSLEALVHIIESVRYQEQAGQQRYGKLLDVLSVMQRTDGQDLQQQVFTLSELINNSNMDLQQQVFTLSGLVNGNNVEVRQQIDTLRKDEEKYPFTTKHHNVVTTNRYKLTNPEVDLILYLYPYLPSDKILDIGAHIGEISLSLLEIGYEVYAFEPFPPTFSKLASRLQGNPKAHLYNFALGNTESIRDMHIASDLSTEHIYKDSTLFNSLMPHAMPDNLQFVNTISVPVKSLSQLHLSEEIPQNIGLVKIDTEGFELEVIHGMGDFKYPVVMTEFWDRQMEFGKSTTLNKLEDQVPEMRQRGYQWHIVIYRVWGSHDIAYYCNYSQAVDNSWGNIFFFQDYEIFNHALRWCSSVLPMTYFRNL